MHRIDWKTRGKKVARATVAALVSIWALYVVLINVFLSTSLFDRVVNQDKMMLQVHYESGWSLWPSTVHAKHLSIRASDSNVAWLLKLDEVTFEIALLDIPRRRFTIESAHGSGISMRIQTKRMTWPDHQDEIKHLPPIDGFPAFAVSPTDPHHPELWDDEQYHLITVSLDDIHAKDVREIWIDNYRFSGHADIHGRFYLKPLRAVDIGPVHAEFHSGEFQQGPNFTLVHDVRGTADVTATRFDPRAVRKNEAMRYFDIATKLRGRSIELAKLPFAPPVDLYYDGVIDASNIGVRIERGSLANGASVDLRVLGPRLAHQSFIGEGELAVHAEVTNDRLQASAELAEWRVARADGAEVVSTPRGYVRLDSADLDLSTTPFEDLHAVLGFDDATAPNAWLLPFVVDGSGELSARVEAWPREHRLAGAARMKLSALHAKTPDLDALGSGDLRAAIGAFHWNTGEADALEVESDLHDLRATTKRLPIRAAEGRLAIHTDHFALPHPDHAPFDAELAFARVVANEGVTAERAELDVRSRPGSKTLRARVDGGRVANGATLPFLPIPLASERGEFRGDARIVSRNHIVSGRANIHSERIGVQTKKIAIIGNSDVTLDIRRFESGKELDLGPSKIEVRNGFGMIDGKTAFTADHVQLDGVARHLDLAAPSLKSIDAHLLLERVAAEDAKAFQSLLSPTSKVKLTGGAVNVSGEIALGGEHGASGDITIDAKRGGFTHGETALAADARLQLKVTGVGDDIIDVSGTRLALRNVDVQRSTFETTQWRGDVVLGDAVFAWASGEPAFGADFNLTAEDARPVLGMLQAPKIAGAFLTMPNVAMRGHVDAEPDGILLRDLYAHGGDVAFRGSYAIVEGEKRGAFVVSKGPLAMGLRLGRDGAHPRFFGLDGWLREEEKKVNAAPIAPGKP